MDIAARVHAVIDDRDIKQVALAKKLDIPLSTLNGYMTERNQFPPDIIRKIAEELEISTDYLLGIVKNPARPLALSRKEQRMVEDCRTLSMEQQELILQMIHFMQEQNRRQ
jgi:transcriptional regulator with XRE-family HTH domain